MDFFLGRKNGSKKVDYQGAISDWLKHYTENNTINKSSPSRRPWYLQINHKSSVGFIGSILSYRRP